MKNTFNIIIILLMSVLGMSCSGNRQSKPDPVSHEVGIAYMNLETGEVLAYNAQTMFHAASTMKTPVMLQLFRMRDRGVIDLNNRVLVSNQFTSIADGRLFILPIQS